MALNQQICSHLLLTAQYTLYFIQLFFRSSSTHEVNWKRKHDSYSSKFVYGGNFEYFNNNKNIRNRLNKIRMQTILSKQYLLGEIIEYKWSQNSYSKKTNNNKNKPMIRINFTVGLNQNCTRRAQRYSYK